MMLSGGMKIFLAFLLFATFATGSFGTSLMSSDYHESFDNRELNAWASYPPNQDTAYDPYVYPGTIKPADQNICLVAKVQPPWSQTQRIGAVKRLDLTFDRSSSISFRYFIKTAFDCSALTVHLPTTDNARYIFTIKNPLAMQWEDCHISWDDILSQNEGLSNREQFTLSALAIQAEFPETDPDMPIYLGLDDIEIHALKMPEFTFTTPKMHVLSEWKERIPDKHYRVGDTLTIEGSYENIAADALTLSITPFLDRTKTVYEGALKKSSGGRWRSKDIQIAAKRFTPGFYRGEISAKSKRELLSTTSFTLLVVSENASQKHPRLLYNSDEIPALRERLNDTKFADVRRHIAEDAVEYRKTVTPDKTVYDFNQFPEKGWLESIQEWAGSIREPREALFHNALAHSLLEDGDAGPYCRDMMLALARFPEWNHPWMENRGFHTYYPLGQFAESFSIAYDLAWNEMSESERREVRQGLVNNFIRPAYESYVVDDLVTSNSSNWIAHIVGGALVAVAAIYGDDADYGDCEPWLSGLLLKQHKYITHAFGRDGSYGEGFRYFNFAMQSFAKTLPVIDRLFNIDFSGPMREGHLETLWTTNYGNNLTFSFGDTEPYLKQESTARWIGSQNGPMNSWAWLVEKTGDPVLAWLYHHLKDYDTIQELLHETDAVPVKAPDTLGNVKFFHDVGTAVFRSGWDADDFLFVFRSGPFYNHQHMDQGSFFLADYGRIFLEERYDGEHHYYDDPIYRSHTIQTIGHNSILIDRNPQSQKTGDPANFAIGMNDQAELSSWLDTESFAFAAGDLERVYFRDVEKIRRNVLYIKPRTILLVDEIHPAGGDIEASLIFRSKWMKDIALHDGFSTFHKDGGTLFAYHLTAPSTSIAKISEPHQKSQFKLRPLKERGYLQVSAKTDGKALVMGTILSATPNTSAPDLTVDGGNAKIESPEKTILVSVARDENAVTLNDYSSDGVFLALDTQTGEVITSAATQLERQGKALITLDSPATLSYSEQAGKLTLSCHLKKASTLTLFVQEKPRHISINGEQVRKIKYNRKRSTVTIPVEAGTVKLSVSK